MLQHRLSHQQLVEFLSHQIVIADGKSIAVLIVDLKRTDRLNAITGKVSSQSIMHHSDSCLNSLLRDADRFAHFENEKILLVLPGLYNKDHSILAATRVLSELRKSFYIEGHPVALRPHIGIAVFPEAGNDCNQLLMHADTALRIATTDQNGFYIYQPKDIVEPKTYSGLDIEIDKAINANEFRVNFQPKIDIATGQCISAEALIRWTAPWGQDINPSLLISTAEGSGQINPLTLWILNTSLRHVSIFSKSGVNIGVSVNLPPKMLEDDELPQIIQQTLDIWGIPASTLTLEITEGSMIKNIEPSILMLTKLRGIGIRLSIDDFGTGYSSLAYLNRLPVHELKIDMHFIRNIHNSIGDKQIVQTIIDLAHNFELITVAEGVEDQNTFDLLRVMGCDVAQGYLFSHALPETDFIEWYRQYN